MHPLNSWRSLSSKSSLYRSPPSWPDEDPASEEGEQLERTLRGNTLQLRCNSWISEFGLCSCTDYETQFSTPLVYKGVNHRLRQCRPNASVPLDFVLCRYILMFSK